MLIKAATDDNPFWSIQAPKSYVTVHGGEKEVRPGSFVQCMQPFTVGTNWPIKKLYSYLDRDSIIELGVRFMALVTETIEDVSSWAAETTTGSVIRVARSVSPDLTFDAHPVESLERPEILDRCVRDAIRAQRDSLSMVPRSVRLLRAASRAPVRVS